MGLTTSIVDSSSHLPVNQSLIDRSCEMVLTSLRAHASDWRTTRYGCQSGVGLSNGIRKHFRVSGHCTAIVYNAATLLLTNILTERKPSAFSRNKPIATTPRRSTSSNIINWSRPARPTTSPPSPSTTSPTNTLKSLRTSSRLMPRSSALRNVERPPSDTVIFVTDLAADHAKFADRTGA